MGTISDKLTYLNTTKGLIKDTINLTGAGITNDTFRSYATKLKQGYLDILNNGIDTLYNNFPKVSGIGSNLSLTPTYKAPIKLNEIQGDTLQNGTPTPSSPVPIQSVTGLQNVTISNSDNTDSNTYEVNLGKNMLDYSTMKTGFVNSSGGLTTPSTGSITQGEKYSTFIKVKPNTQYIFKIFETSSTYDNWFGVGEYTSNDLSTFIQRDTMTTASQNYISFTTSPTTQYIVASARNLAQATKVQLEKGNETSYSPYFTPIELNKIGDYEDSINKSTGKNLCTGVRKSSSNNDLFFDFDKNISQTITLSATINSQTQGNSIYLLVDGVSKGKVGEMTGTANTKQTTTITFTNEIYEAIQNSTTCFLQLYRNNAGFVIPNDGQINNGSIVLPYEPYGKVWYVGKQTPTYTFTGSSSDTYNFNSDNTNTIAVNINPNGVSNNFIKLDNVYSVYCDKFVYQASVNDEEHVYITGASNVGNNFRLYINKSRLTGYSSSLTNEQKIELVKTWLNTNNIKVCYITATPIYEVITNTELIEQLETLYNAKSKNGTTNINVTSENLPMILNVSALKGE